MKKSMKILSIEIVNNKAIKCFQLDCDGKNIEIAGDTGTGKTTAVSALWEILSKGKDTLTHGAKKGHIRVKIGDGSDTFFVAERITTPTTSAITITKHLGTKPLPIDAKDFEDMISSLSVNPHKLNDMKPTEMVKVLLAASDIEIDLDALDSEIAQAEEDRKLAGRAAKASKPVEVPEETTAVVITDLITERDAVQAGNSKIDHHKREFDEICGEHNKLGDEIIKLQEDVKRKLEEQKEYGIRVANGMDWFEKNKHNPTTELDDKISSAEETNRLAAVYEQAKKDHDNHVMLETMHKESDALVKKLRKTKTDALYAAHWPLEGIAYVDGAITFDGMLLDNLGEDDQMLVTGSIAIGDILKHPFKLVRLDGVESMSKKKYEKLKGIYNGHDIQVLSTRVSRGDLDAGEITIVDGVCGEEKDG